METFKSFESQLYSVNDTSFEDIALDLFRHQARYNPVYNQFLQHLGIQPDKIHSTLSIPFLPISFFKGHELKTGNWGHETIFASSGTTGSVTSSHYIRSLKFYLDHAVRCFQHFFGNVSDYHFLALLPSYLERRDSSLVAMMDHFIKISSSAHSGFYLNNLGQLITDLEKLKKSPKKTILWGVSFALMDLADQGPDLSHCIVFETGGMKGRRHEITRDELQNTIKKGLNVQEVHSEYGMTELLSQAYTRGDTTRFSCPPWMRVITRDIADPFEKGLLYQTAGINVVDLANWHSIAFVETEDLGRAFADGTFEVLGRMDNSDVRGCNLMAG